MLPCVGGVGYGGYWAYSFFDMGRTAAKLPEAHRAYLEAGLPFEAKDLRNGPPADPKENAALLLTEPFKTMEKGRFSAEIRSLRVLAEDGKFQELEKRLSKFGKAIDQGAKASQRPRLDFQRDWELGPDLMFPEYAGFKNLVNALGLRAQTRASQNQARPAIQDLRAAFRLAELVGQEPTMISVLVRIACERIALDDSRRVAHILRNDPAALKALANAVAEPIEKPSLERGLRGEMFMGIALIRNLHLQPSREARDAGAVIDPSKLARTGLPTSKVQRAYMARHLQLWTAAAKEMRQAGEDPRATVKAVGRIEQAEASKRSQSNLLNAVLFPVFTSAGNAVVQAEADRRATLTLLTIASREAAGERVNGLNDLGLDVRDPFSSTNLLMSRDRRGLRVYSVGPDQKDNGGVDQSELTTPTKNSGSDVVAALPPIKRFSGKTLPPASGKAATR